MKSLITQKFFPLLLLLILFGCQTIDTQGQYIDDKALTQLERNNLSKDQVIELVGTPTIIPDYTRNSWYYVQRSLARKAWLEPKVIEQRIVQIDFNNNNIVSKVSVLKDSHVEGIVISTDYTRTQGTELNPVQKFVKNIGRFNKNPNSKKKGKN